MEVIDHLRQQPADVDRVGRRQPRTTAEGGVDERVARQPMAIVEVAGDRIGAHISRLGVEHRQLRFLRRADAAVRIQHDHAGVRHAVEGVRDCAARIAGGRGEDRQRRVAGRASAAMSRAISRAPTSLNASVGP